MALWGNNDSKETKGGDGSVGLITNFNYSASAHGYDALTLFGSNTQLVKLVTLEKGMLYV